MKTLTAAAIGFGNIAVQAWIQLLCVALGAILEERFVRVCTQLGKKYSSIGTYCTDPFETLYCKGVDLRTH